MRSRVLPAIGLSVVALALATSFTGTASAAAGPSAATNNAGTAASSVNAATFCAGNAGVPDGNGLTSQNFETAFDAYDANGLADFKITGGKCKAKTVDITGSFSTGGPSTGATVNIYKGAAGAGSPKCTGTGGGSGPNFSVKLSGKCKLKKGTYSVTAQSNQDFGTAGQWYWSTTGELVGNEDMWRNPGNGFGTGCTDYGTNGVCLGYPGTEYLVSVNKK